MILSSIKSTVFFLATGIACSLSASGALVSFAQTDYTVPVGQTLDLDVRIAYEQGDPANDLFSFGVRVVPAGGTPFELEAINVAPGLDFFGTQGAAALIDPNPSILGAKGNVTDIQSPYLGSLLVTYQVRFLTPGSYPANLAFYNTLGPTEQLFVGGLGQVLDSNIVFGDTLITVTPEPGTVSLLVLGSLGIATRRKRLA